MKILIASIPAQGLDNELTPLRESGHEVILVGDGRAAVTAFFEQVVDMAILTLDLPRLAGHEAARLIKRQRGQRYVPVMLAGTALDRQTYGLFRTSLADDYMTLPLTSLGLLAKVDAVVRTRELYDGLERFKVAAEREIGLAHAMFHRITERPRQAMPQVAEWIWPAGHFAGDLIAHKVSPSGRAYAMLVDSTGHGLAAAVATIPTADAFYELVDEDRGLTAIIEEINHRLHRLLPTGYFCSAGLVELDPEDDTLSCWNGGLPPMLMLDERLNIVERVHSTCPPLGIMSCLDCAGDIFTRPNQGLHSLLVYSDGLIETTAPDGTLFGDMAFEASIRQAASPRDLLFSLREGMVRFNGGLEPLDDVSIMTVTPHPGNAPIRAPCVERVGAPCAGQAQEIPEESS